MCILYIHTYMYKQLKINVHVLLEVPEIYRSVINTTFRMIQVKIT